MGLDDVARPVGSISSNKKSMEVKRQSIEWIAAHRAGIIESLVLYQNPSDSDIKFLIDILDNVIQDDVEGVKVTDENISIARNVRKELLRKL